MAAAKEWTKIDPKADKILLLTARLYKLEKTKTYVLATFQLGGVNITLTLTNTKGSDPNKSYVEVLNNLESWCVKKLK